MRYFHGAIPDFKRRTKGWYFQLPFLTGGVGSVQMSSIREHSKETRKLYNMEVYDLFTSFEQSQSKTSSCLEVFDVVYNNYMC